MCEELPFFLAAGPPFQIVLISLPFLLFLVIFLCVEPVQGAAKLGFGVCQSTALTAILSKLGVPLEVSTTLCAIGY